MKKTKLSLFALLLVLPIIFNSCKKNNDDDPVSSNTKITASIDGIEWNGINTQIKEINNVLTISSVSESGSSIIITIYNGFEEGTYILNKTSFGAAVYQEVGAGEGFTTNGSSTVGGQVVISEINTTNKTLSGTFSFDVFGLSSHQVKSITNGVIDKVEYTAK